MKLLNLFFISTVFYVCIGCSNEIGEACQSSTQCGIGRICDLNSKDGYCTISPCSFESCPQDSICVEFKDRQTFCMALCETSEECRDGYTCDQEYGVAPFCRQN